MRAFLVVVLSILALPAYSAAQLSEKSVQLDIKSPASFVQLVPDLAEAEPVKAAAVFKLRRSTKLAALRVAIKEKSTDAPRRQRRLFARVLADPDMLELALAHAEWLESQQVVATEDGERRPVQDFLQFIIDNWDSLQKIIEFLAELFVDTGDAGGSRIKEVSRAVNAETVAQTFSGGLNDAECNTRSVEASSGLSILRSIKSWESSEFRSQNYPQQWISAYSQGKVTETIQ